MQNLKPACMAQLTLPGTDYDIECNRVEGHKKKHRDVWVGSRDVWDGEILKTVKFTSVVKWDNPMEES